MNSQNRTKTGQKPKDPTRVSPKTPRPNTQAQTLERNRSAENSDVRNQAVASKYYRYLAISIELVSIWIWTKTLIQIQSTNEIHVYSGIEAGKINASPNEVKFQLGYNN